MSFELTIPELGKKMASKDLILGVLTKEWPLTLKEIYNRARKEYRYSGSYQSIFKAVNELLGKKVLVKKDKEYEINISWVKDLQSWTDVVETNYFADAKSGQASAGNNQSDVAIMNFNSIFDAEKYLYYFVKNELKKLKNEMVVYEISNLWKVLFYYRAEYNYYKKLMKLGHKFTFIVSGKSDIENRARDFYKKIGIKIKAKKDSNIDSVTFGDYYIQMFIPEVLQKKIRKFISEGRELELLQILDEDSSVKIIVHKDKELAQGLIQKMK